MVLEQEERTKPNDCELRWKRTLVNRFCHIWLLLSGGVGFPRAPANSSVPTYRIADAEDVAWRPLVQTESQVKIDLL